MKKIPYMLIAGFAILILIFPEISVSAAIDALSLCGEVIVPSLFPFFVCAGLLIHSGICQRLSVLLGPVMKPLFNVSGCGSAALVLGTISGYPQGAITACDLYRSGYLSKYEAERLLAFCNNSGPLFVISAIGIATYSSAKTGLFLYLSHLVAALIVGIIFRFYKKDRHSAPEYSINQQEIPFTEAFSGVLQSAVSNILTVCGAIVFFSVFSALLTRFLPENNGVSAMISGILELSGGNRMIKYASIPTLYKLLMSAFTVGFAGICIHLQVAAIASRYGLSLVPYIIGKLLQGVITVLIFLSVVKFFPQYVPTFAGSSAGAGMFFGSLYTATTIVFLLALAILIFTFRATKKGDVKTFRG